MSNDERYRRIEETLCSIRERHLPEAAPGDDENDELTSSIMPQNNESTMQDLFNIFSNSTSLNATPRRRGGNHPSRCFYYIGTSSSERNPDHLGDLPNKKVKFPKTSSADEIVTIIKRAISAIPNDTRRYVILRTKSAGASNYQHECSVTD